MVVPNKFPGFLTFDHLNRKDAKSRQYGCECFFHDFVLLAGKPPRVLGAVAMAYKAAAVGEAKEDIQGGSLRKYVLLDNFVRLACQLFL